MLPTFKRLDAALIGIFVLFYVSCAGDRDKKTEKMTPDRTNSADFVLKHNGINLVFPTRIELVKPEDAARHGIGTGGAKNLYSDKDANIVVALLEIDTLSEKELPDFKQLLESESSKKGMKISKFQRETCQSNGWYVLVEFENNNSDFSLYQVYYTFSNKGLLLNLNLNRNQIEPESILPYLKLASYSEVGGFSPNSEHVR